MESLTSLLEAEQPQLERTLRTASFKIERVDDDHCRAVTDPLTIHFYRTAESVIHSSIELSSVPAHALQFTSHLHTWLVLKSRGEEWPETEQGSLPSDQLRNELQRLARAIPIIGDDTTLRETLLWERGYMDGYARWG